MKLTKTVSIALVFSLPVIDVPGLSIVICAFGGGQDLSDTANI